MAIIESLRHAVDHGIYEAAPRHDARFRSQGTEEWWEVEDLGRIWVDVQGDQLRVRAEGSHPVAAVLRPGQMRGPRALMWRSGGDYWELRSVVVEVVGHLLAAAPKDVRER